MILQLPLSMLVLFVGGSQWGEVNVMAAQEVPLVLHGCRPRPKVAHVCCSAAWTLPTVVLPKMCLCLRRRFCSRHCVFGRVPPDGNRSLYEYRCCHRHHRRIMPSKWVLKLDLAQLITDGPRQGPNLFVCVPAHPLLLVEFVQRIVSFKIYTLSVLSFISSVAEPDATTITAETLALQRLPAGPFDSLSSALLRRGSVRGLKINTDGIQLTNKAAWFRVASQSGCLSTGMEAHPRAKDVDESTLESTTRSSNEKYLHWVNRSASKKRYFLTKGTFTRAAWTHLLLCSNQVLPH